MPELLEVRVHGTADGKALPADAKTRIHDTLKKTLEEELAKERQSGIRPAWHASIHGTVTAE
jgi:hypothetical protein